MKYGKFVTAAGSFLAGIILCSAAEFRVRPADGSFENAEKKWKEGDSIILSPGTYYNHFQAGSPESPPRGLTIRAEIPGSAVFRGDRKAPEFQPYEKGIWKTQWDSFPEAVFERNNLIIYKYCVNLTGLRQNSAAWTYDAKSKTLYIRTSDSADPARHWLSIGVTPKSGINLYSSPSSSGVQDVLLEGFITTGFYSRLKFPDQRIPSSQRKVAWGIVINHPSKNVKIDHVTAVLNGYGIGFCAGSKNAVIENCRAFGNRNPFDHSCGGIGIFNGADNCIIRGNLAGDNKGSDIWGYSGRIKDTTIFEENQCFGTLRTKVSKEKKFAVRNCIANSFTFIEQLRHMSNCVSFGYTPLDKILKKTNLLMRYEKDLDANRIFADPVNFDCRIQGGTPEEIAKRSVTFSTDRLFYWKRDGNDSADGRSVRNAFATFGRVLEALKGPGTEIYIAGPVKGDLNLKGLKNIAIRGRGAFPVQIQGKIILEECTGIKLERLAPDEFIVRGGNEIAISQSAGKIMAEKVSGLRLTHNYIPQFSRKDCKKCFITANVIEKAVTDPINGWSDYNAYSEEIPSGEKNSFIAKAELGRDFTFRNAWQFDGRSIDSMSVGPYRRQPRNVQLALDPPEIQLLAPDTVEAKLTANIPFRGTLRWGDPSDGSAHEIKLAESSNTHAVALSGLKPGKKYFVQFKARADIPECFSNAELKETRSFRNADTEVIEFTTPSAYSEPRQYFISKNGDDSNEGSKEKPFCIASESWAMDPLSCPDMAAASVEPSESVMAAICVVMPCAICTAIASAAWFMSVCICSAKYGAKVLVR